MYVSAMSSDHCKRAAIRRETRRSEAVSSATKAEEAVTRFRQERGADLQNSPAACAGVCVGGVTPGGTRAAARNAGRGRAVAMPAAHAEEAAAERRQAGAGLSARERRR
jgi:hypothetical protein